MAIDDKLTSLFLEGIDQIDKTFNKIGFVQYSFVKKGYSYFIQYKKNSTIIELIYGPPEYHIDIVITLKNKKFEFKDLLQIPSILVWVNSNKYTQEGERNTKNELLWFMQFFQYALPYIE